VRAVSLLAGQRLRVGRSGARCLSMGHRR